MAIAQRPRIGLKDVVYAILDESTDVVGGTPTYGTVYPLANALELSFDPGSSSTTLFADDGAAFSAETVGEMTVSLGQADILPVDMNRILGHTYAGGVLVENTSDSSPAIAIGAKRTMPGGYYEYFWLPKVRLQKPKTDAKTKGASVEFQTPMLEGRVVKLTANNNYRTRVRTDDANASSTTLTNWFAQPVVADSSDLNALNVAIAEGTAGNVGKIGFTFSKTGGGNFTLASGTVTTSNLIVAKSSGIVAGAVTTPSTTPAASHVIYFTPTVAFSSLDDVAATAVRVQDNNGVTCVTTADVITIA